MPKNRIPVQHTDFFAWVEVYDGEINSSSLENDRFYYWLKAKQIHSSKGGYYGELLHGQYTALYKTDALKEKGRYRKGLKTGEWKEWHPNGELKCISYWKNGRPGRHFTYYNGQGKKIRQEKYRHGLLHGKQVDLSDSSQTVTRFRRGKAVIKKQRNKKQKVKIEHGQEIPVVKDTVPAYSSKTKKNLFRFRKKKPERNDSIPAAKTRRQEKLPGDNSTEEKRNKRKKSKEPGKKETPEKKDE